jgi:glutamate N-acetyltransferase/amino-acid N-acetyltransferase
MNFTIMPVDGGFDVVDGFYCDGLDAGFKPDNGLDIGFIYSDTICDIEAIFTSNTFKASPLRHFLDKAQKEDFQTNFVLTNSKNANAMTGKAGIDDIDEILGALQSKFPQIKNPVMSSTGVIGQRLSKQKIIDRALDFDLKSQNSDNFSKSIMTTDAYEKTITFKILLDDDTAFHISAVAKGAGMINPNLATMLCFIVTDANIPKSDMKELLQTHTKTSFNAISVDGDTSTNDTVMLLANKRSNSYDKEAFSQALKLTMEHLAKLIVSDGEGAKKCVAFHITGAKDDNEAQTVAKKLSNSLLVKTALFGEDPNWGRIASTIGASGVTCSEESITIKYGDITIYEKGKDYFSAEIEEKAYKYLSQDEFSINCDLGVGEGDFTAFGCDLGYEYVKINAEYRT